MSMESLSSDFFDPEEMAIFGFNPAIEADRQEWINTTPPRGTPIIDYERDAFEFGSTSTEPLRK